MSMVEWSDDKRPAWVPTWVPSVRAIQTPFPSALNNMKANITRVGKAREEIAAEGTLLVLEFTAFVMVILGFVPGAPPYALGPIAGLALCLVGVFYFLTSAATLGVRLSFLPTPTTKDVDTSAGATSTTLVTEGVYKHCRHPMYLGALAFSLGFAMLTLSVGRLFWVVILYIVLDAKADLEELHLVNFKHSGFDYSKYAKETPKFIPGLGFIAALGAEQSQLASLDGEEAGFVDRNVVDKIAE